MGYCTNYSSILAFNLCFIQLEIHISISSRTCWYLHFFKKDPIFKCDRCLRSPHLAQSHYYQAKWWHWRKPWSWMHIKPIICLWNLNSITAHNNLEMSLLRAYISLHNFDAVSISEIYLDSTTALDDENLAITG